MSEKTTNTVQMLDGRSLEFGAKKKMLKSTNVNADTGEIITQLDFANGETIVFNMPDDLKLLFAAHGAEQKLGDAIAGVDDIDDCVEAVRALTARLAKGEWNSVREANGLSGASILLRALVEVTGKPVDVIRETLSTKTQAEKVALRNTQAIRPVIERLEEEKRARAEKRGKGEAKPQINGEELLGSFM